MAIVASASAGLGAANRGATIVQLRAPDLNARSLEAEARALVSASPLPVVISSRCDVALASGAAGVNLPERDIAVEAARRLLADRLVGRSVHSLRAAQQAEHEGADYVIFGPVWESSSHSGVGGAKSPPPRAGEGQGWGSTPTGLEALAAVARGVRIPVLAIGGMTTDRIAECHAAGAAGYAAIRLFQ